MVDPKYKDEEYTNLGGMNTKASPYVTGPQQFLNLQNFDLTRPGSLTQRPGNTLISGSTLSGRVYGLYEFQKLNGASFLVAATNNQLFTFTQSGFTSWGVSFMIGSSQAFSFQTFVDRLFVTNGERMFKHDGSTFTFWGLPSGAADYALAGASTGIFRKVGGGLSGIFYAGYGYLNDRGFYGAPTQHFVVNSISAAAASSGETRTPLYVGLRVTLDGITFGSIEYFGLTSPPGYGISAYSFYRSTDPTGADTQMFRTIDIAVGVTNNFVDTGATAFIPTQITAPEYVPIDYDGTGAASAFGVTNAGISQSGWDLRYKPKYLEIFSNRMFMGGFPSCTTFNGILQIPFKREVPINSQSVLWFTDLAEPEGVLLEDNIEVRTNDGDLITGLKSYLGNLMVFKERSVHVLSGDDPNNFNLREVSDQYGCVSNQAVVIFDNQLMFLDRKGICNFNGANISIISTPIEPIFQRMNLDAAKLQATAAHIKYRNEVWFAIPVDGSTTNNIVIVYDYLAQSWTTYKTTDLSFLYIAKSFLSSPKVFLGGYSGQIGYFDEALKTDNGQGITCVAQTRFLSDMGNSVTKQFRRVFLDIDPPPSGSTMNVNINFRQDYGTTAISYTTSIPATAFQSRIDFGIPAKSLSLEFVFSSATMPIRINGYTLEYRQQRRV